MPSNKIDEFYRKFFEIIEKNQEAAQGLLAELVALKTISADPNCKQQVLDISKKVVDIFSKNLKNVDLFLAENPNNDPEKNIDYLPPFILGNYPKVPDPKKKTVVIYTHLDVQPADIGDGWDTDPFVLTRKDNFMYGRGTADCKGPSVGWFYVLKAFEELKEEMPVNIKFCMESYEENGSKGLSKLVCETQKEYFQNVDAFMICDSLWQGSNRPSFDYSLKGGQCWAISVECADVDMHSGAFGAGLREGMPDLLFLLNSLQDPKTGKILIENFYDEVEEIGPEELKMFKNVDIDHKEMAKSMGFNLLGNIHTGQKMKDIGPDDEAQKLQAVSNFWALPSLSIHGIEGAYAGPGQKSVIPCKTIGKFSIRSVPKMTKENLIKVVSNHLDKKIKELNSENKISYEIQFHLDWFKTDPNSYLFDVAKRATKKVFGLDADISRVGGGIPFVKDIEKAVGKDKVIFLPMGGIDSNIHAQNERLCVKKFEQGMKLYGSYLMEFGNKM